MPLHEIDDGPEADAVDDVTERTAHDQRQGQRKQLRPAWLRNMKTIQPETPSASTVKNQRCQPFLAGEEAEGRPRLKVSTQFQKGAT